MDTNPYKASLLPTSPRPVRDPELRRLFVLVAPFVIGYGVGAIGTALQYEGLARDRDMMLSAGAGLGGAVGLVIGAVFWILVRLSELRGKALTNPVR